MSFVPLSTTFYHFLINKVTIFINILLVIVMMFRVIRGLWNMGFLEQAQSEKLKVES